MATKTIEQMQLRKRAAENFIACAERRDLDAAKEFAELIEPYGGDLTMLNECDNPYAVAPYLFALLVRDANTPDV